MPWLNCQQERLNSFRQSRRRPYLSARKDQEGFSFVTRIVTLFFSRRHRITNEGASWRHARVC